MRPIISAFGLAFAACVSSAPTRNGDSTGEGPASSDASSTGSTTAATGGTGTTAPDESSSSGGASGIDVHDVPPPDPEDPQASEYCEAIVESFCDFYVRCGRMDVATPESCHEPFLETCNAVYEPQYVGLEAAGLLTLSAVGLAACEEHLAQVACDVQVFELSGPCSAIWSGTQPPGEGCGLDVEYYVCDASAACTIGLDFCGTCETLVEVSGDCTAEGTTCGPEAFCADGTCRARVANGALCAPEDRCMTGSSCVDGVCEGPAFVGLGDACDAAHRCPYLTACVGGECAPTARLGEACSALTPCEAGFCDLGTCQAPRADLVACETNAECSSGVCLDATCQPRPSPCIEG